MKTILRVALIAAVLAALFLFSRQPPAIVRAADALVPAEGGQPAPARAALPAPGATTAPSTAQPDEIVQFDAWTQKYLLSPASERSAQLPEGRRLAAARRQVLSGLIRSHPDAALAAAVPMVVRQQLPAEILELLEERVSGRGKIQHIAVTPSPGQTVAEPVYRATQLSGKEYRAYVYGRRNVPGTVEKTSMHGIALDGHLALAESPLRVLEPGERAGERPVNATCDVSGKSEAIGPETALNLAAAVAVEYNGVINLVCEPDHVPVIEDRLRDAEKSNFIIAAAGGQGSSDVSNRVARAWAHGPKKLLIIRADFSDRPGTPRDPSGQLLDETFIARVVNNEVRPFFQQNSFSQTDLLLAPTVQGDSADITPVLRLPQPSTYYENRSSTLMSDATAAATAAGFNPADYDRIGFIPPRFNSWNLDGFAEVGGKQFYLNGLCTFRLVAHEIGHTYGVVHASAWLTHDGNPISATGTHIEYGDPFDIMGYGVDLRRHLSQWHKSLLQWIPDTSVKTLTSSGVHRLYGFDVGAANLANTLALKIPRDAERDYWIGYRIGSGYPALDNGVSLIWGYQYLASGHLLDMTPTTYNNWEDSALAVGSSFSDPVPGVVIRPVARGGSLDQSWIDVEVTFQSAIRWTSTDFAAPESEGAVTLRLRRERDFTRPISVTWTTTGETATANSDFQGGSGVVTWAAGDAADKLITIPLVSDQTPEIGETFRVTLSAPTNATLAGSADARVTIGETGMRDPSFRPAFPALQTEDMLVLPDGSMVVVGAFNSRYVTPAPAYSRMGIVKLSPDGEVMTDFAAGGGVGANDQVFTVAQQADGRLLIGGTITAVNGVARQNLARLLPDGSTDASFQASANGRVKDIVVLSDGRILLAGWFSTVNGSPRACVARLHPDGTLDPTFVPPDFALGGGGFAYAMAVQPDGKILIVGSFSFPNVSGVRRGIARLLPSGAIDPSFDGIAAGAGTTEQNSVPWMSCVEVQPDGRILVGGPYKLYNGTARGGVARLLSNGALDPSFVADTNNYAMTFQLLPGGRVAIGGYFDSVNGTAVKGLAFLNSNGAVDTVAASAGGFDGILYDLGLSPSGALYTVGEGNVYDPNWRRVALTRVFTGITNGPGALGFTATAAGGTEGGSVTLSVARTGGTAGAVAVGYGATLGTASASDFAPVEGVLQWADGEGGSKTITVNLKADSVDDPVESFTVNLGSPVIGGASLGAIQQVTVSIQPGPSVPPDDPGANWATADIGAVGVAGSSSESGATITVRGSGADIWGTADAFHFRSRTLEGDGAVVARVASLTNTHAWAKAGIMFREALTPGAREVMAFVTPGNHVGLQLRATPGGTSAQPVDLLAGAPVWLMIVRTGQSFAAYRSPDGSNWTLFGTVTCELPATAHVGLAVSSHNNSTLATAVFEHVDVLSTAPPAVPAAPAGLHSTAVTHNSVTLAWTDASSNETGFSIERAAGSSGTFAVVGTAAANAMTFTDSNLAASTSYTYRVRAARDTVFSGYSNTHLVTTTAAPPSWQGADIGNVGLAGSETISGSNITVQAAGADIYGTADGFRFVYQPWSGDGEIVARVMSLTNTNPWAKAGVMFRETLAANSANVAYVVTPANASGLQARSAAGGTTSYAAGPSIAFPTWIKLVRAGNVFSAFVSANGTSWTPAGTQTVAMGAAVYVGVAATSHTVSARTTAAFEQVQLPSAPPPPPPPAAWTQTNLGNGTGSFSLSGESGMSLFARGNDLWGTADDGVFVQKSRSGNVRITVRVAALNASDSWAKAGIMVRESLAANSANLFLGAIRGGGVTFQQRAATGGATTEITRAWAIYPPVWLRLTRTGDTFTAARSNDGTTWTTIGTQTLALPASVFVGLGASSHSTTSATIDFTNLAVE